MISIEGLEKRSIRRHYQLGTLFYRSLWGPHIHHGLWSDDESAYQAQCRLTDTLAEMAGIARDDTVADIGCGIGGSAIRLAEMYGCRVTGVTLSPVQRHWAAVSSRIKGTAGKTSFIAADAESVDFGPERFDVIWSIECTEHLFDKAAFVRRASEWLRPGGRLAVCVWFEGSDSTQTGHRKQVEEVCRRFLCPSLATRDDYTGWMLDRGLRIRHNVDWTERVMRTWEICKQRVQKSRIRSLARILGREQVDFVDGFDALLKAYRSGAMQYGAIVAEKVAS